MCTIGPLRAIGFLNSFWRDHPGIEITLREGVPGRLSELLHDGSLDVAMAQPGDFEERFDVVPLYREHFVLAFPAGHRFEAQNAIRFKDIEGEAYLQRVNCEYKTICARCARRRNGLRHACSEREDDSDHGDGRHGIAPAESLSWSGARELVMPGTASSPAVADAACRPDQRARRAAFS